MQNSPLAAGLAGRPRGWDMTRPQAGSSGLSGASASQEGSESDRHSTPSLPGAIHSVCYKARETETEGAGQLRAALSVAKPRLLMQP